MRNTFKAYDKDGIKAIKPKIRGRKKGEKRTLTPAQEKEIFNSLVNHDPEQLKIKGCMWTQEGVQELIQKRYGMIMPLRTIGEYLALEIDGAASGEGGSRTEAGTGECLVA